MTAGRRPRAAPLIVVGLLGAASAGAQSARDQLAPSPMRITIPPGVVAARKHPITYDEIITHREVSQPTISADGKRVAFVVRQAFLDINGYRTALFVMPADSGARPRAVLERAGGVSSLRWSPSGDKLYFVAGLNGRPQLWALARQTGQLTQLTRHATGVAGVVWSADGRTIAFTARDSLTKAQRDSVYDHGVLWRDGYEFGDITEGGYLATINRQQVWVHDLRSGAERKLWEHASSVEGLALSADGSRLALTFRPSDAPENYSNRDIGLIDVRAAKFTPLVTWGLRDNSPVWSPDGKSLVFLSHGNVTATRSRRDEFTNQDLWLHDVASGKRTRLSERFRLPSTGHMDWAPDGRTLFIQSDDRHNAFIASIPLTGGLPRRITTGDEHFSECSLTADVARAACVRQTTMLSPEVALVNLGTGRATTITELNPEYRSIDLGAVETLRWTNKFGDSTHGYLVRPLGYTAGRRYPLIVVLYGFANKFITQSQWISGSPAQRFAAEGYAVLLMNYPNKTNLPWRYGNFAEAAKAEAWSPLASMEEGVRVAHRS
ncbi:MAG TPA: hypothetical protein VIV65_06910, partial [Gemmatimonadaceae bacterium]